MMDAGITPKAKKKTKEYLHIHEILLRLKKNKLVAFYTNEYDNKVFLAVFLLLTSEEDVLFQSVTPYGEYDGYGVIRIDKIYRIEKSSKYLRCLAQLCEKDCYNELRRATGTSSCFTTLFTYAWENSKIIRVGLIDDKSDWIFGYVTSVENNVVTLKGIDEFGDYDGQSFFLTSDCVDLSCDGMVENKIQWLYEMNHACNQ
jgi:hypothetical protein